jgi:membrane protein implicated in regulation of membrane protease activity
VADLEVTGKMGRVIVRVRGSKGPGEVLVRVRGGHEAFIAYADTEIERDTDVLVIHSRGARSVDVVPWADAMDLETPELPID